MHYVVVEFSLFGNLYTPFRCYVIGLNTSRIYFCCKILTIINKTLQISNNSATECCKDTMSSSQWHIQDFSMGSGGGLGAESMKITHFMHISAKIVIFSPTPLLQVMQ